MFDTIYYYNDNINDIGDNKDQKELEIDDPKLKTNNIEIPLSANLRKFLGIPPNANIFNNSEITEKKIYDTDNFSKIDNGEDIRMDNQINIVRDYISFALKNNIINGIVSLDRGG